MQLSLMNSKALCLTKKYSDIKWEEFNAKKHKLGTYKINKTLLSVFDDKRFVLNDGIHALAYFHKDLKNHRWPQIKITVYK